MSDKPKSDRTLNNEQNDEQNRGPESAYKNDDPKAATAKVNLEDKANATKRNVVHGQNVNRP